MKNTHSFSKYLLVLFSIVILIACKPDDGKNGFNGNDGASLTVATAGLDDCSMGGFEIFEDGVSQGFVCNGLDGKNITVSIASASDCISGGYEVFEDGVSKGYLCSGTDGLDGADGTVLTVSIASVTDCSNGGYEIFTDSVSQGFVCNGIDGSGSNGSQQYWGANVAPEPEGMNWAGTYEYRACMTSYSPGLARISTIVISYLDIGSYHFDISQIYVIDDSCNSDTYDSVASGYPSHFYNGSQEMYLEHYSAATQYLVPEGIADGYICYNFSYVSEVQSVIYSFDFAQNANGDIYDCAGSTLQSLMARKIAPPAI